MTAHELAKKLLEMPDYPVTVRGYEGGVDIIESIEEPADLEIDANKGESYVGRHEYVRHSPNSSSNAIVKAIHIGV